MGAVFKSYAVLTFEQTLEQVVSFQLKQKIILLQSSSRNVTTGNGLLTCIHTVLVICTSKLNDSEQKNDFYKYSNLKQSLCLNKCFLIYSVP